VASWREIDRIRKSPREFRALAKRLLTSIAGLTDWERDFLTSIVRKTDEDEYSTRQSEKLLQIRDDYESVTETWGGFSVRILLKQCYEGRIELTEPDEEWIAARFEQSPTTISRKHVGRLLRCARQLNLIDDDFENYRAA
jgi:hypothetical protein